MLCRVGTCRRPSGGSRRSDLPNAPGSISARCGAQRRTHYEFALPGWSSHKRFWSRRPHRTYAGIDVLEVRGERLCDSLCISFALPQLTNQVSSQHVKIRKIALVVIASPVTRRFKKSRRYLLRFCYFRRVFTILGRLERNRSIPRASWSWPLWSDKPAEPYFHARWCASGA